MLHKRAYYISGIAFLLIGAVVLISTFQNITGYILLNDMDNSSGKYAGIWFIISGLAIIGLALRQGRV